MVRDRLTAPPQVLETRRRLWSEALTLPGQPDLATSLVAELAEYLRVPAPDVELRCVTAAFELVHLWEADKRGTPGEIDVYYDAADAYLYDLTWLSLIHI